jgi:hypothetical protein
VKDGYSGGHRKGNGKSPKFGVEATRQADPMLVGRMIRMKSSLEELVVRGLGIDRSSVTKKEMGVMQKKVDKLTADIAAEAKTGRSYTEGLDHSIAFLTTLFETLKMYRKAEGL